MGKVDIEGVTKRFGKKKGQEVVAVDDLDLELAEGELLVLLGPSGCGKSTMLRCLAGLESPTEGVIRISGTTVFDSSRRVDVPANRRDIGMVFQNYALWPHMSVRRNVEYPLRARHLKDTLGSSRVDEVLKIVQCGELADRYPSQLSGGQQQRVALARAIVSQPAVMLLDEPLSNLDTLLRVELRAQLQTLHRTLGFTGVYVTHDQIEALNLGDRVAVMRAGRFEQVAPPAEVFDLPATSHVAEFVGFRNRLEIVYSDGAWRSGGDGFLWDVKLPTGVTADRVEVRLRPEALTLVPRGGAAGSDGLVVLGEGLVKEALFSGSVNEYLVSAAGEKLHVVAPRDASFDVDEGVDVAFKQSSARVYANGELVDAVLGTSGRGVSAGAAAPARAR